MVVTGPLSSRYSSYLHLTGRGRVSLESEPPSYPLSSRKISPRWEGHTYFHTCTIYTGWWELARKTANWLQGFLPLSLPPARKAHIGFFRDPPCGLMGAPVLRVEWLLRGVGRVPRPGQGWQLLGDRPRAPGDTNPQPVTHPKPRPGTEVAVLLPLRGTMGAQREKSRVASTPDSTR